MCLIIVADTARPESSEIENADLANPDGLGIAYKEPTSNLVTWRKGISVEELKDLSASVPLPYVMHFRLATHGGKSAGLCHPFPISRNVGTAVEGQARQVLFHNGIWNEHVQFTPSLRGSASDTRIMAWVLWRTGEEDRDGTAKQIATQAGRLVLFSPSSIERFGDWVSGVEEKDDTTKGCYYSNLNHCYSNSYDSFRGYGNLWSDDFQGYSYHTGSANPPSQTKRWAKPLNDPTDVAEPIEPYTMGQDTVAETDTEIKCHGCGEWVGLKETSLGVQLNHDTICNDCALELGLG